MTIATLYKSMVRPHLEYGNAIWGPHFQGDIAMVESVQRRATKLIGNLKNTPYHKRLEILKLPSLQHRRKRGNMIQVYKIVKGFVRIDTNKLFEIREKSRTRGHCFKMYKEHAVRLARKNNFPQKIINNWNSLPDEVVNAPSINVFKERLDEYWKEYLYETSFL